MCAIWWRDVCPIRRAFDALQIFCYQARENGLARSPPRWAASTCWYLRAESGENSIEVRAEICESLSHLGIRLDAEAQRAPAKE